MRAGDAPWGGPRVGRASVAKLPHPRPLFLPFEFCHLPFDPLVLEKKVKIQMANGKCGTNKERTHMHYRELLHLRW